MHSITRDADSILSKVVLVQRKLGKPAFLPGNNPQIIGTGVGCTEEEDEKEEDEEEDMTQWWCICR